MIESRIEPEAGPHRLRIHLLVDQALVAHAYRRLLARRRDHEVCGATRSPAACLEAAVPERAGVVLFDLRLPEHAGLEWIAELKRRLSGVRVLMLREQLTGDFVRYALESGVDGALVRTEDECQLFLALDALRRGQPFLSQRLGLPRESVDTDSRERDLLGAAAVARFDPLERRVFEEMALGHGTTELAAALHLELERARELEQEVRERLDGRSISELTRLAIRCGILPRRPDR